MPIVDAVVDCPVFDSFRVRQVAGLFDVPLPARSVERFKVEVPGLDEDWTIGVIVGPSGSGKSTIAKMAFGDALYTATDWPTDRAVIDGFGDRPIKTITQTLTSVGFSSPPAWIKPYAVLSNGEKFRCDLARGLLRMSDHQSDTAVSAVLDARPNELLQESIVASSQVARMGGTPMSRLDSSSLPLIVFDEFTSVVDRTVARIGSAAVAKAIRSGRIGKRFVAVTCHYDVVPWLEPDWVLDMASGTLARGRLRRPDIRLDVRRVRRELWQVFKRHHYLSAHLHPSVACFAGFVDGSPATFTAVLYFPHPARPGWREHRTVCLPDFQGVGLGSAMSEFIAAVYRSTGKPYYSTTSHPALMRHRCRSKLWRVIRRPATATRPHHRQTMAAAGCVGRITAGFEYVGPARLEDAARLGVSRNCNEK
jgi:GNAT superfamily N-acetyltransferase